MIRVIIEREIAQGLEQYYEAAIGDLLDAMIKAPGYLAGESPRHSGWGGDSLEQRGILGSLVPFGRAAGTGERAPPVFTQRRKIHPAASIELPPRRLS